MRFFYMCSGITYISFFVGMAVNMVGDYPPCATAPFDYKFPIIVLFALLAPFICGYVGGRK